ncbi:acyl-CoA dehydrogenase family protein, partial [Mycetohabitans sp. B2]
MPNKFDERRIALREQAARFARDQLSTDIAASDRASIFHRDGWRRCAEFGLFSMALPEDRGGAGAPLSDLLAVMEGLGYGSEDLGLLFSLNAHLWTVALPLAIHGTPTQRSRFLPGLMDGSL